MALSFKFYYLRAGNSKDMHVHMYYIILWWVGCLKPGFRLDMWNLCNKLDKHKNCIAHHLYLRQAFVNVRCRQFCCKLLYSYIHQRFPFCHFCFQNFRLKCTSALICQSYFSSRFLVLFRVSKKITLYAADILNWKVVLHTTYFSFIRKNLK